MKTPNAPDNNDAPFRKTTRSTTSPLARLLCGAAIALLLASLLPPTATAQEEFVDCHGSVLHERTKKVAERILTKLNGITRYDQSHRTQPTWQYPGTAPQQ